MQAAAYLRQSTQDLHRQTESVVFGQEIMEQGLSLEQYRDLIANHYFLYRSLEPMIREGLSRQALSDFRAFFHSRLGALEADAALLGLSSRQHGVTPPDLESDGEVLGGLYVLLGSKLGGRLIYQSLKATPSLQSLPEFHFFASSGDSPAREWPQFCRLLDQQLRTESDLEEARAGAEAVFCFFRDVHAS